MSTKFLPLAGIAVVLAVASYIGLSTLFPHEKAEVVESRLAAEEVFSSQANEADAQPVETSTDTAAEPGAETLNTALEVPVPEEGATVASTETSSESSADPALDAEVVTEEAAPVVSEAEIPVAVEEPAPAIVEELPVADTVAESAPEPESAPAPAAPAASGGSGLSREQLAKIVAEAAAQAAAETAKSIAEQAARDAAAR